MTSFGKFFCGLHLNWPVKMFSTPPCRGHAKCLIGWLKEAIRKLVFELTVKKAMSSDNCTAFSTSMTVCCFFLFSESEADCQFSSLPNMAQLVQFISGHPYLPSSGLDITFSSTAVYPDADSCFCFLRLPTVHNSYQEFRNPMKTAIICQYRGYGRG